VSRKFRCVGHRGLPEVYPENSVEGLLAALVAGADAIELDVQMTRDGRMVLLHDPSLLRTAKVDLDIREASFDELEGISAHEQDRLGTDFSPSPISGLREFCDAVQPCVQDEDSVFIEIKKQSIESFGRDKVMRAVLEESNTLRGKRVIISFDLTILDDIQALGLGVRTGWVLSAYNQESLELAKKVQPDFLIINYKFLPKDIEQLPSNWQWFLYDIVDKKLALEWWRKGASYIETWDCRQL
jgi:glycerophosphoryl diester phosphodiesterase